MPLIASVLPVFVCLLYVIPLTSYPPQASAISLPEEYDQEQTDTLISQFVQSQRSRDPGQLLQFEQLKRRWNQDQLQNKRRSKQRRRNKSCNPLTGKCSAGWKRSPPTQQDAADLEDRSLYFPPALKSPLFSKRAPHNPRISGRTRKGNNSPRSLRRSKCNHLTGRCSAGWKRSPMSFNDEVSFSAENGKDRFPENVFDILDRLEGKSLGFSNDSF